MARTQSSFILKIFHYMSYFYCFVIFFSICYPWTATAVQKLIPVIIRKIPHPLPGFTQGLAIVDNILYESVGLYNESQLRVIDLTTGTLLESKKLPSNFFAEGIAILQGKLVQLTWREQKAFVYHYPSLEFSHFLHYLGEGWGLCENKNTFWMSNGSSTLMQIDAKTFAVLHSLPVHLKGKPINFLNDLICVKDVFYANVWKTEEIIKIDSQSGEVLAIVDASSLLNSQEKKQLDKDSVLNGIAFHSLTQSFYLTGKNWPWIFEVLFKEK